VKAAALPAASPFTTNLTGSESHMSATKTQKPVVLEPASQALVEATAGPPFL
jgi:hypothetical protein